MKVLIIDRNSGWAETLEEYITEKYGIECVLETDMNEGATRIRGLYHRLGIVLAHSIPRYPCTERNIQALIDTNLERGRHLPMLTYIRESDYTTDSDAVEKFKEIAHHSDIEMVVLPDRGDRFEKLYEMIDKYCKSLINEAGNQ